MARTVKEIKKDRSVLQDQISLLKAKMDALDNEKEALKTKDFARLVKGTTWSLPKSYFGLVYQSQQTNQADLLEKYVFEDLGLYPHGRTYVAPNVQISCNDSSIEITVEIDDGGWEDKNIYKKLFEVANEYHINIDLSEKKEDIEYHQSRVTELAKELLFLQSLKVT